VLLGGQLNQLRHTRKQEAAADETAIEIMIAADLNPAALARAFVEITGYAGEIGLTEAKDQREAKSEKTRRRVSSWLSSHPDTDDRIANANNNARDAGPLPLSAKTWRRMIEACAIKNHVERPEDRAEAAPNAGAQSE
jgi:Zn-dependent protease with chaperone function